MSADFRPRSEPGLFDDLPLHSDSPRRQTPAQAEGSEATPAASPSPPPTPESLPLFSNEDAAVEPSNAVTRPAWRPVVPFNAYLTAALIDLGAIVGVMLVIWAGLWWLDVDLDLVGSSLVLLFLLPFSFLYQVFPLAFWGRTPGMARVGLVARSCDGQSLSFSQAALRWLSSLLTLATAGLPWILTATTGRSLADRLSDSQTLPAQ
jgi:uncharacterized RDD family membrane protein YckC